MPESTAAILTNALRTLHPTGPIGFEGLIACLLQKLTGHRFFLSASGRQEGRDMRARTEFGTHIAVECKRYLKSTALDERELVAELAQAINSLPGLDLWVLVTSRSVPDQIERTLRDHAHENGVAFAILESLDDSIGDLAVLCAEFANEVASYLPERAQEDAQRALEAIRASVGFASAIARLRRYFSSSWIGFDQARLESHAWLQRNLSSSAASKAEFAQHLAVIPEALPREQLLERISTWFAKEEPLIHPLVVLGEEGDGKTWLAAYWLNRHANEPDFPLVLFMQAALVTATNAADLLPIALTRISEGIGLEGWRKRVQRWTASTEEETPRMILVLDGVNEKFTHSHWRNLFASLDSSGWSKNLQIVITCRAVYWDRHFYGAFGKAYERLTVPPFNDKELDAALKQKGLSRDDLSPSILPLIRKPRYFDLAARHHKELADSGDITVARLLYEDWRDRYERHINTVISPEDFNDFLKRIAERAHAGESRVRPDDVLSEFPVLDDQGRQELFSDLVSGGVLLGVTGGHFEVSSSRLQMGLGLLLVDRLLDVEKGNANLSETISRWLEPAAGIDEKAKIVEHAVLHALILDDCSDDVRSGLLGAWLDLQNRDDPECRNFTSYLPLCPSAFFNLAPELWKTPKNNAWGQQLLLEGVLRWRDVDAVHAQAIACATEWLGYVFTQTPSGELAQREESEEKYRLELHARFETNLAGHRPEGSLRLGSFVLKFIDDEGLTRLGRLALAYISHMPRSAFAHAFAVGTLAESLAPYPSKTDLISWVMRTAPDCNQLRTRILEEANQLARIKDFPSALIGAHRLLLCEGSVESLALEVSLPPEPLSDWQRRIQEHEQDPCNSFFALTQEQCVNCLARDDVAIFRVVEKSKSFWPDPTLPIPPNFRNRIRDLAPVLDPNRLWQGRNRTPAEFDLETAEPGFLACDPAFFAHQIRTVFRDAGKRSQDALWHLSLKVDEYSLLFDNEILEILRECWDSLSSLAAPNDQRQIEWTLFDVILPLWSPEEQLQRVLARPADAFDLRNFIFSYKEVPGGLCNTISIPDDENSQRRAAWFLARSPEFVRSRHFPQTLSHGDSFVRSIALKALYRFGEDVAQREWAQAAWHHEPTMHPEESYWGSLLLAKVQEVDAPEAVARMHPAHILELGDHRAWNEQATSAVVDYITSWLAGIGATINVGVNELLPPVEISDDLSAPAGHAFRFVIRDIAPDRSVHFINPTSIWGGMYAHGNPDKGIFDQEDETAWRQRVDHAYAAADAAKHRGAFWLDQKASMGSVKQLLAAKPSFAQDIIRLLATQNAQTDQFIAEAYGLLTAICGCLLCSDPETGVALYRRLKARQTAVIHVHRGTKLDWADTILFEAPQSEHVADLWSQSLERCASDSDLLSLSILASCGDARNWLMNKTTLDFASDRQMIQARAVTLAAMIGIDAPNFAPGTWLNSVSEEASRYRKRAEWSKVLFGRFLSERMDEEAFAAFRLLLHCVDRRFWTWKDNVQAITATRVDSRRSAFLSRNLGKIREAIQENEKPMVENFLGKKLARSQAWPWLPA